MDRFRVGQRVVLRRTIRRTGFGTRRWGLVWKGSEGVVRSRRRRLWGGYAYEVEFGRRSRRTGWGSRGVGRRQPRYNASNRVPNISRKTMQATPSRLPIVVGVVLLLIFFIMATAH
jgi:hypothetical protein